MFAERAHVWKGFAFLSENCLNRLLLRHDGNILQFKK